MAMDAFDLAERFQTPVFLMTDLDLGMNNWMADPFPFSDQPIDRGKVLRTKEELEAHIAKFKEFARYRDVDGDGIPYRTLPGFIDAPAATYFTRGSGHNERAPVHGAARRLQEQHGPARAQVRDRREVRAASRPSPTAAGLAHRHHRLRLLGLRRRGGPRHPRPQGARRPTTCACARCPSRAEAAAFVAAHDRVYVVDQNRDGQMYDLLRLEIGADTAEAALHPPLRRLPPRRRDGDRGDRGRGEELMSSTAEPKAPRRQPRRPDRQGIRRLEVDALRRLRPRRHHAPDHAGALRDVDPALQGRQDVGHRLLVQDDGLLRRPRPRLQRRPRPHAGRRDRRDAGQPVAARDRRLRRRRHGLDRRRASSCTCCAATSRWSTSSRTTACTA